MLRIIITGKNSTVPAFAFSGIPNSGNQPASVAGGSRLSNAPCVVAGVAIRQPATLTAAE